MKKLLLFLTVLSTVGFVGAQAVGTTFIDGVLPFQVVEEGVSVIIPARNASGSLAVSGDLVLPSTASGFGVTYSVIGTGESSFNGIYLPEVGNDVTSITIPSSITELGKRTFRAAANVASYTLVDGLVTIGPEAFHTNSKLTSIVIPNTVTTIGASAFSSCALLTSVTLSQNLTQIPNRVFQNSSGMTQLTVPASVTDFLDNSWNSSSVTTLIMEGAVPPAIAATWAGTAANITVYTDAANIAAYLAAPIWADMIIKDITTLSTNNVEQELAFSMHPNPTSGLVSFTSLENIVDITIFNINGSVLLNSKSNQLDVSSLASGVYFAKVKTVNGFSVKKLIKK